ncbi:MAG: DALR anticodon-binding domain-containing protein, partial [Pseudomonadota bacterium]|nr:DALR anticodon-binding domain-containing protein [Pseudomonadota bacterium]
DKVDAKQAAAEVFDYCMDRLKGYYQDQGIGADAVDSVLAGDVRVPSDIHKRILAVEAFRRLPEAEALTAANKRIRNILRKSDESISAELDPTSLREEAERRLAAQVKEAKLSIAPSLETQDYEGVLKILAGLRNDVDAFFDQVMVMAEEPEVRRNRLALLSAIEDLFLGVADISRLQ